ncbi:MAG: hypothetical protein AB7U20_20600 [Planctomycetaceae bacterium]
MEGIEAGAEQTRSGDDTRKRGWFWHWNAIVTQFAPLVGLKGVGLLNSYTVWTDRREESPHRGYAFPSQQSEADFYGEDRSELITINKILVALDLIEIRKEMVLRVDESGRRWRVPHNLYRVKDRDDGFSLTAPAVDRVVQLAARDKSVYRYIRHIFSPKFKPIDAHNVWTAILEELATTPSWELLAARTAQEEARASARTRAGHKSRKGGTGLQIIDTETPSVTGNDSESVGTSTVAQTSVEQSNNGSEIDVERSNRGSARKPRTSVAASNDGGPTDVAPTNTTYHQEITTTTTGKDESQKADDVVLSVAATQQSSFGPGGQEAPVDRAAQDAALRAFFEANHREATIAERKLLQDLAERFEPAARSCGAPHLNSGWKWVGAAIFDAVDAGSTYVAPRRVREILSRWEREGAPGSMPIADGGKVVLGPNRAVMLPHGRDSGSTWAYVIELLSLVLDGSRLQELFAESAITGFSGDEVIVEVPTEAQARRIDAEYRPLIVRKLGEAMRRPVGMKIVAAGKAGAARSDVAPVKSPRQGVPGFPVAEIGLTSVQLWAAVLEEMERDAQIEKTEISRWLRPAALIDRLEQGAFIIGAPSEMAAKRIAGRYGHGIARAMTSLLGGPCELSVVVASEWPPEGLADAQPEGVSA